MDPKYRSEYSWLGNEFELTLELVATYFYEVETEPASKIDQFDYVFCGVVKRFNLSILSPNIYEFRVNMHAHHVKTYKVCV